MEDAMNRSTFGGSDVFGQPEDLSPTGRPKGGDKRLRHGAVLLLLTAAIVAAIFGTCLLQEGEKPEAPPIPAPGEERPLEQVTTRTFSAALLWQIPLSRKDEQ